jgi:hypothetical protein
MRPPGSFKVAYRHRGARSAARAGAPSDAHHELAFPFGDRSQRLLASLRDEILRSGDALSLRVRCVFPSPREIYRIELEVPERDYQRTTLLDRDSLEELLEIDAVRAVLGGDTLGA